MTKQKTELTFKHNLKHGRHGWLRLTPAYSVKVVHDILEQHPEITFVLDPFSGTGTTGLVCGERGINCDLLDINPFLVWLAKVKTANYQPADLREACKGAALIVEKAFTINEIGLSAEKSIAGQVRAVCADSRQIHQPSNGRLYDAVITSPPYPNRISYIRELRPYMYWLGYLNDARQAADIDWQAIGGTWGVATSRLSKWEPNGIQIQHPGFEAIVESIRARSHLLANYVHKYFSDISIHLASLYNALTADAKVFYVVGNSKFYDTLVPVEAIYAGLLQQNGFVDTAIATLRKRNSKKELIEFVVSARKPK